jgi:hypothetical protein
MRTRRKFLPSPAMIVACLALVAAIGGSAYAASKINGKQIKSNTITGKQIKEETLKGVEKAKLAKDSKKLKGEKPAAYKTRWLLVGGNGQIIEQSGGFKILDAYATNANVYIDAGESLEGHGLTATIGIVNKGDQYSPSGVTDTNFGGEVSVGRCQTDIIECAPANAKNASAFVVSPRNSDGSATNANTRKAVYVEVSEGPAPAPAN